MMTVVFIMTPVDFAIFFLLFMSTQYNSSR